MTFVISLSDFITVVVCSFLTGALAVYLSKVLR